MKPLLAWLTMLTLLFIASSLQPLTAQTSEGLTTAAGPFRYDSAQEVTVRGTVSAVLPNAAPGMVVGSHLLIATASGPADASLGRFGLVGAGAPSVAAGQQVEATGVIRTIKDKPVLLVRTVKMGSEVFIIRNNHGVLLAPRARERADLATNREGVSR